MSLSRTVRIVLGLLLTGCAMAQDVKLRHPDGRAVTCEPGCLNSHEE